MASRTGHRERDPDRAHVRTAALGVLAVFLLAIGAFAVWASMPLGPSGDAIDALAGDEVLTVTALDTGWLFAPSGSGSSVGFVLYPGGRVDARSYAPLARAIAAEGYTVALAKMPLNLAVFDPGRASALMDEAPSVQRWAVGGHSLGGAMAAAYTTSGDDRVTGLVLLAAYPSETTDLAESDLAVLSVLGNRDEVVERSTWDAAAERLPPDATYVIIEGGNHAQFGDYGVQPGDGNAAIGAMEQLDRTAEAIVALLRTL